MKSWVIGVKINDRTKAYDWNILENKKIIEDSFAKTPLLLTLDKNQKSFYVLNRNAFHFYFDSVNQLKDKETNSVWNINGNCIDGKSKGKQLMFVQSYQEFWHSWKAFHPETEIYK